jgi:pre-peptidase
MLRRCLWSRVLLAATLLLPVWTSSVTAAAPPGGTLNATKTRVSWQGQFYAAAATVDPTLCPPGAVDPVNIFCDHFQLAVGAAGSIKVTISWPSPHCQTNPTNPTPGAPCEASGNDFDLYVYDSNSLLVGSSASPNPPGNSETVTFAATAQTYEVRVIPFFVVNSDYAGTATLQVSPHRPPH